MSAFIEPFSVEGMLQVWGGAGGVCLANYI